MKINVPENKNPRVYWPPELKEEGYSGVLNIHAGVCCLVVPKPSASNNDVAKDLKLLSQQFEYKGWLDARLDARTEDSPKD